VHDPLVGGGAGSFQVWWQQHRPYPLFVRDAHSLYLETFGELGMVGLLLIASMVVAGVVVGASRVLRAHASDRTTTAALAASFVSFAVAASADWIWELTVVAVVGVALLALTVQATAPPHPTRRPVSISVAGRLAVAAASVVLIGMQAILMFSDLEIGASQGAVRSGDTRSALAHALDAHAIEPWASTPYLQLALIAEQEGRIRQARRWTQQAINRAPSNWTLWLVSARLATKAGSIGAARRSLREARRLNPLADLPPIGR
jgi:O-antigen ligase